MNALHTCTDCAAYQYNAFSKSFEFLEKYLSYVTSIEIVFRMWFNVWIFECRAPRLLVGTSFAESNQVHFHKSSKSTSKAFSIRLRIGKIVDRYVKVRVRLSVRSYLSKSYKVNYTSIIPSILRR